MLNMMEFSESITLDNEAIIDRDINGFVVSPAHKLIYLKYMQLNPDFIYNPEKYPKIIDQLCAELDKICGATADWIPLMKIWVQSIKNKCTEMRSRKNYTCSIEDFELMTAIDKDNIPQEPAPNELSCILDHLEIAHNSPKVWTTISLELEALGCMNLSEEFWQKAFERWSVKVKRKKYILDQMNLQPNEKSSYLNPLESRLLEFTEICEANQPKKENERLCRVCLITKDEYLKNVHELCLDELTLAQKIGSCAKIEEITTEDGFPQYICESCCHLLESAYQFKILCEKSEQKLKSMEGILPKEEYVEYIIEEAEEIHQENDAESGISNEEDALDTEIIFEDIILIEKNSADTVEKNADIREMNEKKLKKNTRSSKSEGTHSSVTTTHQCEACGIICYNKVSLQKHMHNHSIVRQHKCSVCEKEFKTRLSLKIHMRSHTGERPYVCEVCGKAFTQDSTLSYHRAIHTGEKKYLCSICDYRARNINDLKIHMRTHTGDKPYACDQCSSKFSTSSNLQKHLRRHTGIKNFQTCGKAFKTWSASNNHRAIHSEVKLFTCPHCPYRGSTKANLKIHNRTHTGVQPYACDQCPLKFSTASNRHKHVKNVHEKVKLHQCGSCGRSFFSRESARKHMVIHTGLKPYKCIECPQAYGWYNGLQKHMKTQHPGVKMPTEKHFIDQMENKGN